MLLRIFLLIGLLLAIVGPLGFVKLRQIQGLMAMEQPEQIESVTTAVAETATWEQRLTAIGTIRPVQGVLLTAEQPGEVVEIAVENGASVEAGDLILRIDTSVESSQLKATEARLTYAQLQLRRNQELVRTDAASQSAVDLAQAEVDELQAEADRIRALIEQKEIHAPFAGRVGIRQVNVGDYVAPGTAIIPLQRLDTLFVNFSVPQRFLKRVQPGNVVNLTLDSFPGETFEGQITAINPVVDDATRNVEVQATLPNPEERLRPGMFAQVNVTLPESDELVVVPTSAIAYAPYGNSVYVITEEESGDGGPRLVAKQTFVTLGPKRGDQVAIIRGVEHGAQVATSGVFKLRSGVRVQVNNEVTPANDPTPNPSNI